MHQSTDSVLIEHLIVTLTYRFQKAIHQCSPAYPTLEIGKGVRTPQAIVNHTTHVLLYAAALLEGKIDAQFEEPARLSWEKEVERFYQQLETITLLLQQESSIPLATLKIVLQGPLADVMTHIGQLALLRRMADTPIPKEDFTEAKIGTSK